MSKAVENPDEETFQNRREEDCPGHDPDVEDLTGSHSVSYKLPDDPNVAVRSVCVSCDEVLGEWGAKWRMVEATRVLRIGECPRCDKPAWVGQHSKCRHIDGDVWHESCRMKEKYGFEDTDGDAPIASNPKKPYNLHRTVTTEINGEAFEWDEYLYTRYWEDHGRHNLPTRHDLTPSQLERLREWATGENPTGDELLHEKDNQVGVFPAEFVLVGGYISEVAEKWICPDCGEIVEPKDGEYSIDLRATCAYCGSDRWLTAGEIMEESVEETFAPLSDRESQVIRMDMTNIHTDGEIADALDVQPSTVREYRERAKSKAKRGKKLYDHLSAAGILREE